MNSSLQQFFGNDSVIERNDEIAHRLSRLVSLSRGYYDIASFGHFESSTNGPTTITLADNFTTVTPSCLWGWIPHNLILLPNRVSIAYFGTGFHHHLLQTSNAGASCRTEWRCLSHLALYVAIYATIGTVECNKGRWR